ncbi:hypothetical protein HDU97_005049 [Phlyctochytrium planicorne]|nr:hypothetical protein HDU97_005049 [Phlyctochytrium planicorne]
MHLNTVISASLLLLPASLVAAVNSVHIFVHPEKGSDKNDGSQQAPFQHLPAAAASASKALADGGADVEIVLAPGSYRLTESVNLSTASQDKPDSSLVIRSGDERNPARISGDVAIEPSCFKPVDSSDPNHKRIQSKFVSNVLVCKLPDSISKSLGRCDRGYGISAQCVADPFLYVNGERLRPAGWPDNEQGIHMSTRIDSGDLTGWKIPSRGGKFTLNNVDQARWDAWANEPGLDVDGVLSESWIWTKQAVASIDAKNHSVTMATATPNGLKFNHFSKNGSNFLRLSHSLYDLDTPQEAFFDEKAGSVYIFAKDGKVDASTKISFPSTSQDLLTLSGPNIFLRHLVVENGRASGISVNTASSFKMEGCTINNFPKNGLNLNFSDNTSISNNLFSNIGSFGLSTVGPVSDLLSKPTVVISQNTFTNISWFNKVYNPAVNVKQSQVQVVGNLFSRMPHLAIKLVGSNNLVARNEFVQVNTDFFDMGAVYAWAGCTNCSVDTKTVISENYFHDFAAGPGKPAIYADDLQSGWTIDGNLFARMGESQAIYIHGGDRNVGTRNVFYKSKSARYYTSDKDKTKCNSATNVFKDNKFVVVKGQTAVTNLSNEGCTQASLEPLKIEEIEKELANVEDDRKGLAAFFKFQKYGASV